jgi:tRNA(fMet)-specific endonuclease VapC
LALYQEFFSELVSLPFDGNAAIALANDLILVTHNTREFSRVEELRLEDWELSV